MNELKAIPLPPLPLLQPVRVSHRPLKLGRDFASGFSLKRRFPHLGCWLWKSGLSRPLNSLPSLRCNSTSLNLSSQVGARAPQRISSDSRIWHDVGAVRFPFSRRSSVMTVQSASETAVVRDRSHGCSPPSATADSAHGDFIRREGNGSCFPSKVSRTGVTEQHPISNGGGNPHHVGDRDSESGDGANGVEVRWVGRELNDPGLETGKVRNSESVDQVGLVGMVGLTEEADLQSSAGRANAAEVRWVGRELNDPGLETGNVRNSESVDQLGLVGMVELTQEAGLQSSAAGRRDLVESREEGTGQGLESSKRMRTEGGLVSKSDDGGRIAAAWDHWRKLGEPKFLVAPMVDQSELPFRMLCRKYGATAAYTPMLHSRLFAQDAKYRATEFSTCAADRPLFVQFCANNPDTLLEAARLVESQCDYVDINLGCPQRIAKKGNYGAFLMDNQPLIKSLVSKLASNLTTPVACKIRVYPDLEKTLAYAKMLEEAGCSLLAVHGRTRDQKNGREIRADWDAIKAVKAALRIPVLANGNIRWLEDVHACIEYTGVDGVLSAESLLENPALFGGYRTAFSVENGYVEDALLEAGRHSTVDELMLLQEYLELCEQFPIPMRMVRGHVHKLLGKFWFKRNPDVREELNRQHKLTVEWLKEMVTRLAARRVVSSSENGKVEKRDEEGVLQAA